MCAVAGATILETEIATAPKRFSLLSRRVRQLILCGPNVTSSYTFLTKRPFALNDIVCRTNRKREIWFPNTYVQTVQAPFSSKRQFKLHVSGIAILLCLNHRHKGARRSARSSLGTIRSGDSSLNASKMSRNSVTSRFAFTKSPHCEMAHRQAFRSSLRAGLEI